MQPLSHRAQCGVPAIAHSSPHRKNVASNTSLEPCVENDQKRGIAKLAHWVEMLEIPRPKVLQAAVSDQIGLYFLLQDAYTVPLPRTVQTRPFESSEKSRWRNVYLQASEATLQSVLATGVATHVQEAYLMKLGAEYAGRDETEKVYVELPMMVAWLSLCIFAWTIYMPLVSMLQL